MLVKRLKQLSFGSLALIVAVLMLATVVEKVYGSQFAVQNIYGSVPMMILWGVMTLSSLAYILKMRAYRSGATFGVHLSFVLILLGAVITHLSGLQGTVHLRMGEKPVEKFMLNSDDESRLPFALALSNFELKYYAGTQAPMDYESRLTVIDGDETIEGVASMNNVFTYKNYRFYQSGYDRDGQGTVLAVSYDPCGIAVTYTGYLFLFLSFVAFFFSRNTGFRRLLKHPLLKRTVAVVLLLLSAGNAAKASELPSTLPRNLAEEFCDLYVYYNDRICPLQTLAKDFTVKLCGKTSYRGLSAEQVFAGWFFFYDEWKTEPMIKIKGADVQALLGVDDASVRLTDFVDNKGYKLDEAFADSRYVKSRQNLEAANEKFNLVSMLATGSLLKIYPYSASEKEGVTWYSLADKLPVDMPEEQWAFIRNSMSYVAENVAMNDSESLHKLFAKIKKYQERECRSGLPSSLMFKAEKIYNKVCRNRAVAIFCLSFGFMAFVFYCRELVNSRVKSQKWVGVMFSAIMVTAFLYVSFNIVLRWVVCRHVPLSNGFETMQFLAWSCLLLTLFLQRRFAMAVPFGLLLGGLSLMVSVMGESNPQITQLMPVLQSPLLSIHVVLVMVSYSLLAFMMLTGGTAVIVGVTSGQKEKVEYLQIVSRLMLYPAVFTMALGIFIGAVWANVSWGRYWGWDPKEVWALVTMLIYSFLLHTGSLQSLKNPLRYHVYTILAFFSVLITYFGVNFFLGGLHSYA